MHYNLVSNAFHLTFNSIGEYSVPIHESETAMQNMLRTLVGMLAGAALVILIMIAAGVRAQDGGIQTLAGEAAPAQTTIVDGVLAASSSMQYQGVLLDPATAQPKPDGTYNMTFRLYNTGPVCLACCLVR